MIPQDSFTIIARVVGNHDELRRELETMNLAGRKGMADPDNATLPFGRYDTIHFARFVVLEDNSVSDRAAYGLSIAGQPVYLCFMVDCDGSADELLARIARQASGLDAVFRFCEGFTPNDRLGWLREHRVTPQASYVNWVGRSVLQVQEEESLHVLLRAALPGLENGTPQQTFRHLKSLVKPEMLTPMPETPTAWRVENLRHLLQPFVIALGIAVVFLILLVLAPIIAILALCIVVIAVLAFIILPRRHEQTDPFVHQPYDGGWVSLLREREDWDVSNQYTAMGSIKPGPFRRRTEIAILWTINWIARHICTRGSIGRIGTIHFAHWVFLDDKQRGFFCSNYDGGHEAYMDDFINKAGFGLNFSFSSFIGYPTTNWLFAGGAWLEQDFKRFQRRHQIPTDVWYKAYPGLTARDLARNSRIRNGIEKEKMSDDEIRRWLDEI
jgi:hypothetical protein